MGDETRKGRKKRGPPPGPTLTPERQALMTPRGEDSDLENNVSRLCEYLSDDSSASTGESPLSQGSGEEVPGQYPVSHSKQPRHKREKEAMSGTELNQFPSGSYLRRMGRPVFPQDFLNIPPPAHPPEDSPMSEGRPLPPQRKLPPLPPGDAQAPLSPEEEPHYEEARPPPPHPRPSKSRLEPGGQPGAYEVSDSMARRFHSHNGAEEGSYLRPASERRDWGDLGGPHQILEQTETGSFYIPSGHTTMSSLSPQSGKLDPVHQNKHNYSLLGTEGTTVPVPVIGMRPETGTLHHSYSYHAPKKPGKEPRPASRSWRTAALALAALLALAAILIVYLLVSLYGSGGSSYAYYTAGPSLYSCANPAEGAGPAEGTRTNIRPLPESFSLGDPVLADLPPAQLVFTSFALQDDSYVQFNLSIPPSGKLALYGRQTLNPTPTQHSFSQIVIGDNLHAPNRLARALALPEQSWRSTVFIQYLLAGKWNLGFLNDGAAIQPIRFAAALTDSARDDCKYGCYGAGSCKDGKCYCFRGYTGAYCEESVCPVLCSGNGLYVAGSCHCHEGWKGADCDVPASLCLYPDCGGHGHCSDKGECACDRGWTGELCGVRTCPDPNCGGRGHCADGVCYCQFGWKGEGCEEAYTREGLCASGEDEEECSGHGSIRAGTCQCNIGWTGLQCQSRDCVGGCGSHGSCDNGSCVCARGWGGERCEELSCGPGCEEHGRCGAGKCECERGWNGANCQLPGCPGDCGGHGDCRRLPGSGNWRCACAADFAGPACTIPLELRCDDGTDNDGDGLTDCEDSECCGSAQCAGSPLCHSVPNPHSVLMREQPPPPQASFFHKIKFLLEPESVQQYPDVGKFNESRVSVIRGRVVNNLGGALIGVRVTDKAQALYGFTITRGGGLFDFVVNGGGSVTLQFMRQPFKTSHTTIRVGWNRIIRIDDVVMLKDGEELDQEETGIHSCSDVGHHVRPMAVPSWLGTRYGSSSEEALVVMGDSKSVHSSIPVPATSGLRLSYSSADAAGYESALRLFLVPDPVPSRLRLLHLRIGVEGTLTQKTLEAAPNLTYTYGWDKRNTYKQKVYGLATASLAVGYQYHGCPTIFWERSELLMSGHKSGLPDLGGWNLHVRHHLDILNGVLERGDGSVLYLREEAHTISTTLGNDRQRPLQCPFCNSHASQVSLFEPVALAAGPDGSLYIGDHNLVRRLSPNNSVTTILQLRPADTAHGYYLAVEPVSGALHVSLPLRREVWRVREWEEEKPILDPETNYRVVVGTGEPCRLAQTCGDGGPAEMARLAFPKGIAFDSQGELYIADERRIRAVSVEGLMRTVIGGGQGGGELPCQAHFAPGEAVLSWPTHLAVDPLSDRLAILDHDLVFQLAQGALRLILGMPAHCSDLESGEESVRGLVLNQPTAIAMDPSGNILVAESDRKRIHRVRSFTPGSEDWFLVAGKESKCDCHPQHCPCGDDKAQLATEAHLHLPIALAVSPDSRVHIADLGNLRIRSVGPAEMESPDPSRSLIQIPSPTTQEVYVFNRFGQHLATRNLLTGGYKYNFTYHTDSSYGRLVNVVGGGGQKAYFIRESPSLIHIETTHGRKSIAHISVNGMLEKVEAPDGSSVSLEYDANTGLLASFVDQEDRPTLFQYDYFGHLQGVVRSDGRVWELETELGKEGLAVRVVRDGLLYRAYRTTPTQLFITHGGEGSEWVLGGGRSVVVKVGGVESQLDASPHPLLAPHHSTFLKHKLSLPPPPHSPASRAEVSSRLEWRYYVRREGGKRKRVAQVNGVNVLTVEYDRETRKDTFSRQSGDALLHVHYNNAGQVKEWESVSEDLASLNLSYDALGLLSKVSWSSLLAQFQYDRLGRLSDEYFGDSTNRMVPRKYGYEDETLSWPSTVQTASGPEYQIAYDAKGRLESVESPMGERHGWRLLHEQQMSLVIRTVPNCPGPFLEGRDAEGRPLLYATPDPMRRAHFLYSQGGEELVEGPRTLTTRRDPAGHALSVAENHTQGSWRREQTWQGPLLVAVSETRQRSKGPKYTAHFSYQWDDLLRLTAIGLTIHEQKTLLPMRLEYEPETGRLSKIADATVQYSGSKVRILGTNFVRESIYDPQKRLSHTRLLIQGRKVSEQGFQYDATGRLHRMEDSEGGKLGVVKRGYDLEGRLSEMSVGAGHSWGLHFDLDGRFSALDDAPVRYDARGRLASFGPLTYSTDVSGSIVQRDQQHFQ